MCHLWHRSPNWDELRYNTIYMFWLYIIRKLYFQRKYFSYSKIFKSLSMISERNWVTAFCEEIWEQNQDTMLFRNGVRNAEKKFTTSFHFLPDLLLLQCYTSKKSIKSKMRHQGNLVFTRKQKSFCEKTVIYICW